MSKINRGTILKLLIALFILLVIITVPVVIYQKSNKNSSSTNESLPEKQKSSENLAKFTIDNNTLGYELLKNNLIGIESYVQLANWVRNKLGLEPFPSYDANRIINRILANISLEPNDYTTDQTGSSKETAPPVDIEGVTGSDGRLHKLDENGNPVLHNPNTNQWEPDTTPDAVISPEVAEPVVPTAEAAREQLSFQASDALLLQNKLESLRDQISEGANLIDLSREIAKKSPEERTDLENQYLNTTNDYISSAKSATELEVSVYPDQAEKYNSQYHDWLQWEKAISDPSYEPDFISKRTLSEPTNFEYPDTPGSTNGDRTSSSPSSSPTPPSSWDPSMLESAKQNYEIASEKYSRGEISKDELDQSAKTFAIEKGIYRAQLKENTPKTPELLDLEKETNIIYQDTAESFDKLFPEKAKEIEEKLKGSAEESSNDACLDEKSCPINSISGETLLNPPAPQEIKSSDDAFKILGGADGKMEEMFKTNQELAKDYEKLNEEQINFVDNMSRLVSNGVATTEEELNQKWLAETGSSYSKKRVQEELNAWEQLERDTQAITNARENSYENLQLPEGQLPEGFDISEDSSKSWWQGIKDWIWGEDKSSGGGGSVNEEAVTATNTPPTR